MRKFFSLEWSRISQYYKNNRFIFILFLVSSIICTTSFAYLYGNYISSIRLRNDESRMYRRYSVYFDNVSGEGNAAEAEFSYDDIVSRLSGLDFPLEDGLVICTVTDNFVYDLAACFTGQPALLPVSGRCKFTEEELEKGEKVIIIPHVFARQPDGLDKENDTWTLGGETFRIIGRHAGEEIYIPPETFKKLNHAIYCIDLYAKQKAQNTAEDAGRQQNLQALFPRQEVASSFVNVEMWQQYFPIELAMICLVYGLSMFSYMFLMKYMMETSIRENVIYGFVGASKNKMTALLLIDNICFSVVTVSAGLLLHLGLKEAFFDKVSVSENIYYTAADYGLLFVLGVGISLLTLLPFLLGFRRHSLLAMKGYYSYT